MYKALLVQSVVSRTVIVVLALVAAKVATIVLVRGDTLLEAQGVVGCPNHAIVVIVIVVVVEETSLRQETLPQAGVGWDRGGSRRDADDEEGGGSGKLHFLYLLFGIVAFYDREVMRTVGYR